MKNKRKVSSAKISENNAPIMSDTYNFEINGYVYSFQGIDFAEGLYESIETHCEEDRDFKDNIVVFTEGKDPIKVYAPAALCAFGFIDKKDLAHFVIAHAFEDDSND